MSRGMHRGAPDMDRHQMHEPPRERGMRGRGMPMRGRGRGAARAPEFEDTFYGAHQRGHPSRGFPSRGSRRGGPPPPGFE